MYNEDTAVTVSMFVCGRRN